MNRRHWSDVGKDLTFEIQKVDDLWELSFDGFVVKTETFLEDLVEYATHDVNSRYVMVKLDLPGFRDWEVASYNGEIKLERQLMKQADEHVWPGKYSWIQGL